MRLPCLAAAVLALSAGVACKGEAKDGQPLRFSLAFRANGSIGECADYVATPILGGSAQAIADGLVGSYKKTGADFVLLEQPCARHFAERKALGSCDVKKTNQLGELSVGFLYYESVTPLAADKRDCLKGGGSWAAL